MEFDGVFYGEPKNLFLIPRDSKFTWNACWKQVALNDRATNGHEYSSCNDVSPLG
jgi:hypothetical protein